MSRRKSEEWSLCLLKVMALITFFCEVNTGCNCHKLLPIQQYHMSKKNKIKHNKLF